MKRQTAGVQRPGLFMSVGWFGRVSSELIGTVYGRVKRHFPESVISWSDPEAMLLWDVSGMATAAPEE